MSEAFKNRPTWTEINLENLAFNFQSVKKFVGPAVEYMAVVKADAYGHGAATCAKKFESEGIDWLGVALPEEGLELRESGIQTPILCLGSFWNGQESLLLENNITPVIYRKETAESFDRAAAEKKSRAKIHIKIDIAIVSIFL